MDDVLRRVVESVQHWTLESLTRREKAVIGAWVRTCADDVRAAGHADLADKLLRDYVPAGVVLNDDGTVTVYD